MKRGEILQKATDLITGDRQEQHGDASSTYAVIGALWGAYLLAREYQPGESIHPFDVLQMMSLLKIGRASLNPANPDNYIDNAGYTGLAGEIAMSGGGERYQSAFQPGAEAPHLSPRTKKGGKKRARNKA